MPSQEDYLDNLLKDMAAYDDKKEIDDDMPQYAFESNEEQEQPVDLDTVSNMTEEEIERLLSAGTQPEDDALSGASDMDLPDEDVLKMLEESHDSDMQQIQELLEKSDRNVAVDDSIEEMLQEPSEEENPETKIWGEQESIEYSGTEDKKKAAQEKKELARIKREEKKKQAAEKRAEKKAAKKAAKEAAREEKAKKKSRKEQPVLEEQPSENTDEGLFDMSVLDSIVADADKMIPESEKIEEQPFEEAVAEEAEREDNGGEPFDVFSEETDEVPVEEETTEKESEGLDFDLGNLFGDGDVDNSLMEGAADSDFPDFVALEADETKALLSNHDDEALYDDIPKKNKGFFSRILNFLTEEDETEDEENEDIKLSQENRMILDEMDSETEKGKGKKKAKVKKEKKPKKESKPKKVPKAKKEKQPKAVPIIPEKKLSFKKIFPILLIGISVGVLLFVFVNSAADFSDRKAARTAYYEGDYQTCYQSLFGKELDETESIMFGKSESILYIRLWVREYEMFAAEGAEAEALDCLLQTVAAYPDLYMYASQWNAESEVAAGYATVLNILTDKYGLSESEAMEIVAEPDDIEYTKMVYAIVGGESLDSWNRTESSVLPDTPEEILQDILPEENEIGEGSFIDNRKDGEAEE